MKLNQSSDVKLSVQIAPLIDVVFLLLIYFMVTASIVKKEGDLSFNLPAIAKAPVDLPVEARICIDADGIVELDGFLFDKTDHKLSGLVGHIKGLKQMADAQHAPFFVTLDPDDHAIHGRVVDVLDACAASKVRNVGFARHDV